MHALSATQLDSKMDDKRRPSFDAGSSNHDVLEDDSTKTEGHMEQPEDGEKTYPPRKVVVPAIAGVYLAVFLVALVCYSFFPKVYEIANALH